MDGCLKSKDPESNSFGSRFPTKTPIVSFNCSVPNCSLEAVSIEASQSWGGPAVRVYNGDARSVYIRNAPNSGMSGPAVVVDANDVPTGAWTADTGGGFTLISHNSTGQTVSSRIVKQSTEEDPAPEHALLLGVSGEANARVAIQADGSVHYGDGSAAPFSGRCTFASMCQAADAHVEHAPGWRVTTQAWDPPSLDPGQRAVTTVASDAARRGDICHASHSLMPFDAAAFLSVTAGQGALKVWLKNEDDSAVDVVGGTLRVACLPVM
eukprot:SAG22_NODE_5505_length_1002_cov_1.530454_1_plen_267_part_00